MEVMLSFVNVIAGAIGNKLTSIFIESDNRSKVKICLIGKC